jgi:hypothetical protein
MPNLHEVRALLGRRPPAGREHQLLLQSGTHLVADGLPHKAQVDRTALVNEVPVAHVADTETARACRPCTTCAHACMRWRSRGEDETIAVHWPARLVDPAKRVERGNATNFGACPF